jgi:hypothetical protein
MQPVVIPPLIAAKSKNFTVTTTAVKLDAELSVHRKSTDLWIHNAGAADVFVGGADVTAANGLPVKAGTTLHFPGQPVLWAVSAGSVDVRVLEATRLS